MVEKKVADFALSLKTSKLDPEYLESFFKTPYFLIPKKGDSWNLYIPRFIDMQVGYLEKQTEAWNVFLINRYAEWLGGIPEALKKEIGLKSPAELKLEGDLLFGSPEALGDAWRKYKPFLREQTKEGIRVNPKRAFELIAALLKDGVLPFTVKPIPKEAFIETTLDFDLRDYQREAWETLKQYSNVGIYWPPSAGKTFITLYAMAHLKGPHLIVVPQVILKEQWEERIAVHLPDLKEGIDFQVATYQTAIGHLMDKQWQLLAIDESQHLPANSFAKLSMIKRKYTLGLTATPQREDGREELIFALTGKPVGLSWDYLKKSKVIKSPTAHVWIVKNDDSRFKKLAEILRDEKKTIVFCDSLETGKMLAAKYEVPFVSGETKVDRLKTMQDEPLVIVSRVGDQGISLPDIARVIEVRWLFGSRRQELQRFGRLLHGESSIEAEHHIIMTAQEYQTDRKRLFSIMDKGFKLVLHKDDVSDKVIEKIERSPKEPRPYIPREPKEPREPQGEDTSEIDAIYQKVGLPRAPKFRIKMSKGQRKIFDFLIQNDGQFYSKERLALLLEYSSPESLYVVANFPKMVSNGWIKQKKDNDKVTVYGTEMRAKVS